MENEILSTLQTIRGYLYVIVIAVMIWISLKVIDTFMNGIGRWIKAWDEHFNSNAGRLLAEGEYQEAIVYCKKRLKKQPNHLNAHWYIAKAYFYLKNNELSKEHFEKVVYLEPEWEKDINVYLEKIGSR
ncbi:MAG: tetratricopeptide repeat protein [Candidatus Thiodiazotropha endolucinida]